MSTELDTKQLLDEIARAAKGWENDGTRRSYLPLSLPDDVRELRARIAALERERDAYKRAKEENDERFMLERDAALRENAELRVQREMLVQRVTYLRMTEWLNKRAGDFTADEAIEAERATREGVENWLRKESAAIDAAREAKP